MIPTAGQDARSVVNEGRQGTGQATVFNSGNFDPVNFWKNRYETVQQDQKKRTEERKQKMKDLDLLGDYIPQQEKFTEAIYQTYNDGIDAFADAMIAGQDPLDVSTPLGRSWVEFRGNIAGMVQAEKDVVNTITAAKKAMRTSPEKYDQDVFEATIREYEAAPDWKTKAEIIRTKPLLAPEYNLLAPTEVVKDFIQPNVRINDIDGQTRVEEKFYNEADLDKVVGEVLALPEFQPYKAKYEQKPIAGMSYEDFIKSKFMGSSTEKRNPLPSGRFGGVVFSSGGIKNDNWEITAYDPNDWSKGMSISTPKTDALGGQNAAVNLYFTDEDGNTVLVKTEPSDLLVYNGKIYANARVTEKYKNEDGNEATRTVTKMFEMTDRNLTNFMAEAGFSEEAKRELRSKMLKAKQASKGKGGSNLPVKPRETSTINGE